jgi:hypothetical protein
LPDVQRRFNFDAGDNLERAPSIAARHFISVPTTALMVLAWAGCASNRHFTSQQVAVSERSASFVVPPEIFAVNFSPVPSTLPGDLRFAEFRSDRATHTVEGNRVRAAAALASSAKDDRANLSLPTRRFDRRPTVQAMSRRSSKRHCLSARSAHEDQNIFLSRDFSSAMQFLKLRCARRDAGAQQGQVYGARVVFAPWSSKSRRGLHRLCEIQSTKPKWSWAKRGAGLWEIVGCSSTSSGSDVISHRDLAGRTQSTGSRDTRDSRT